MQALGMTDGFFTVLLMGGCKVVRFLLDSKIHILYAGVVQGQNGGFLSRVNIGDTCWN